MKNPNYPCSGDTYSQNLKHNTKNGKDCLVPTPNPAKISNLDLKLLLDTDIQGEKKQLFARNLTLYIANTLP